MGVPGDGEKDKKASEVNLGETTLVRNLIRLVNKLGESREQSLECKLTPLMKRYANYG